VVSGGCRIEARVDPGEQHSQPGRDQIGKRPVASSRQVGLGGTPQGARTLRGRPTWSRRSNRTGRDSRSSRRASHHGHQRTDGCRVLADNRSVITVADAAFEQMVGTALDSLPAEFAALIENVAVLVEHGPGPRGLLGLYEGVPLTRRTTTYAGVLPDRITIYQRAICALCDTEADVVEQVRRTVIHEVGHYFGISDERLRELGW
jgi:predicted Zn-dependent protease with MMP-like domain